MAETKSSRVRGWIAVVLTAVGLVGPLAAGAAIIYVRSATAAATHPLDTRVTTLETQRTDDRALRDEDRKRLRRIEELADRIAGKLGVGGP
jgi:uncharacterized membrane protein